MYIIYILAWEPSAAKVTKSYSRRLPELERFYQQNKCINSNTCYVFLRIDESKGDFSKNRLKRLKRVKDKIKHKGCQKSARIKKML